jgi:hypothetical protein
MSIEDMKSIWDALYSKKDYKMVCEFWGLAE